MKFLKQHPQIWVLSYLLLYLPWFFLLEARPVRDCVIIQLPIDRMIPFCEYFIVPYLLWFPYLGAAIGYFLFTLPKAEFYRFCKVLFGGMTVCLVLYTAFYTGLNLRPQIDADKNVFTWLVAQLWQADTSTNVCPSIHTFATLTVQSALSRTRFWEKHPALFRCSEVLALSIVLATLFLKQHSVLDVICAGVLLAVMHRAVYGASPARLCFGRRLTGM